MKLLNQEVSSLSSIILVILQFGSLGGLLVLRGSANLYVSLLLVMLGLSIGLWAIISFRLSVNVFPDVRSDQELIVGGPYRWVRHPMYVAVLLCGLGLAISNATSIWVWIVMGVLTINMIIKVEVEEIKLKKSLPSYTQYQTQTSKLIPFIY